MKVHLVNVEGRQTLFQQDEALLRRVKQTVRNDVWAVALGWGAFILFTYSLQGLAEDTPGLGWLTVSWKVVSAMLLGVVLSYALAYNSFRAALKTRAIKVDEWGIEIACGSRVNRVPWKRVESVTVDHDDSFANSFLIRVLTDSPNLFNYTIMIFGFDIDEAHPLLREKLASQRIKEKRKPLSDYINQAGPAVAISFKAYCQFMSFLFLHTSLAFLNSGIVIAITILLFLCVAMLLSALPAITRWKESEPLQAPLSEGSSKVNPVKIEVRQTLFQQDEALLRRVKRASQNDIWGSLIGLGAFVVCIFAFQWLAEVSPRFEWIAVSWSSNIFLLMLFTCTFIFVFILNNHLTSTKVRTIRINELGIEVSTNSRIARIPWNRIQNVVIHHNEYRANPISIYVHMESPNLSNYRINLSGFDLHEAYPHLRERLASQHNGRSRRSFDSFLNRISRPKAVVSIACFLLPMLILNYVWLISLDIDDIVTLSAYCLFPIFVCLPLLWQALSRYQDSEPISARSPEATPKISSD